MPRLNVTAVAVRKAGGSPGTGFRDAMIDAGYIEKSDPRGDRAVWEAALQDVYEYWRPKLDETSPWTEEVTR